MAGPFRGDGGKGPAIKEKITFFLTFFLILLPFKKNYFTLDNLSNYEHITLKFVIGIFTWLLQYFPNNRAILVQKIGGRKKIVKIRFRLFKDKKSSYGH